MMKKILAILIVSAGISFAALIEDFHLVTNGVHDYFAMIDISLVADNHPFKAALDQGAFKKEIAGATYVRVGMFQKNFGTQLTKEQFQPYFEHYGDLMIAFDQYKVLVQSNQTEEDQ